MKTGAGLVRLGDLLPKAEIPSWDEWQQLCAIAAETRKAKLEIRPRPEPRTTPQLIFSFDV